MKVGLSGAVRGRSLVSVLGHFDLFELAAVFDPDDEAAERACRELGEAVERAESFDELVERSELVVVASPAAYHVPQSVAALEAGRHVVSEVPACIGIEEAKALKKAQASSGKHFVMAENANYFDNALVVKALVREGLFGQVYYAEAEYLHDCRDLSFTPSGEHTWRAHIWKKWVYLTHSLGPALTWFDDEPARVRCLGYGAAAELNDGLQGPAAEVIEVELRRGGSAARARCGSRASTGPARAAAAARPWRSGARSPSSGRGVPSSRARPMAPPRAATARASTFSGRSRPRRTRRAASLR